MPPATPARISWNMSAAYSREQDGHSLARRLPQRTWVTPSGSSSLLYEETISPVLVSIVSERPRSRIGCAQFPTRASASDQASKSRDTSRSRICCSTPADSVGRSSGACSPNPGKASGTSAGRVAVTRARVPMLTGSTTLGRVCHAAKFAIPPRGTPRSGRTRSS